MERSDHDAHDAHSSTLLRRRSHSRLERAAAVAHPPVPSSAYLQDHASSPRQYDSFVTPGLPASHQDRAYNKRSSDRRDVDPADEARSAKRSRSSANYSDNSRDFSSITGDRLKAIYGQHACWVCAMAARTPERAHVFPKNDQNFENVRALGLVHLSSLGDLENAIPLCPNCHSFFDDVYMPQLIIAPAYLEHFFDVEQRWQADFMVKGPRARQSPTSDSYFHYCVNQDPRPGMIPDSTRGGLYTWYANDDIFSFGRKSVQMDHNWHGDPMAMVYRAIQGVERIAMPKELPLDLKRRLMALHALYEAGNELQKQLFETSHSSSLGPGLNASVQPDQICESSHHLDTGPRPSNSNDASYPPRPYADRYSTPSMPSITYSPSSDHRQSAGHSFEDGDLKHPSRLPTPALTPSPGKSKRPHEYEDDGDPSEKSLKRTRLDSCGDRLTLAALKVFRETHTSVDMVSRFIGAVQALPFDSVQEKEISALQDSSVLKQEEHDTQVDAASALENYGKGAARVNGAIEPSISVDSIAASSSPSSNTSPAWTGQNWWGTLLQWKDSTAQEAIEQHQILYPESRSSALREHMAQSCKDRCDNHRWGLHTTATC